MREIVHVQIGRYGNSLGKKFWRMISEEHGLDEDGKFKPNTSELQKQRIDVYFVEGADERHVPRAILIDFDCTSICNTLYESLFHPDKSVCGRAGTNDNWAKGYYTEGNEILNDTLEITRTEVEACDSLQGIQIVHALAGGSGSGFGSLFAQHLMEEYPNRLLKSYALFPSQFYKGNVQDYNAVLTIPYLIDHIHEVFCISNEAVDSICSNKLRIDCQNFDNANRLISLCMSGVTACLRFPGQLNASPRKLLVNMVPFPRLHFFVPGYAPLIPKYMENRMRITVRTLIQYMFKSDSLFINCDPGKGKFLTAAAIFRGRISPKEVDYNMIQLQDLFCSQYVEWIPHNIKTAICDIPTYDTPDKTATSLSNTTAIQHVLTRLLVEFQKSFRRKAYLSWYLNEGMEESDFLEAQNILSSLISEYQQYENDVATTAIVEELIPYRED